MDTTILLNGASIWSQGRWKFSAPSKAHTLFKSKIWDFLRAIYDLTKISILYSRPDS